MRRIKTIIIFVLLGGFCCSAPRLASAEPPAKPGCGAIAAHLASAEPLAKPGRAALQQSPPHITDPLHPRAMISSARPPQCRALGEARVPFVANEGQVANPDVKYYARTFGGTVYALSDGKIVYALPKYEAGKKSGSAVITEILRGALQAELSGAGKSPVVVSSFIGNQPEKWKTNLPAFDRLDFGEVYEGISLLLSARGNNVEKIFVLSPGADPRDIAFGFEGASGIEIMPDGKLELQTALGAVYFTRPIAWQIDTTELCEEYFVGSPPCPAVASERRRIAESGFPLLADPPAAEKTGTRLARPLHPSIIEVAYALDEDGTVRFELGPYDQNKVLVIDPLLASTFIGGGGADAVQAMVVDSQTNVYVAGYTASSDFPTNSSSYCSTNTGGYDAFVSKFDASLGSLSASTYIGGSSNDQATAIGIDASSRIWIAGYTESANFPHPSSPMYSTNRGGRDAFVAILTSNLNSLVQATYLGGSNTDYAAAIAMDNSSRQQYVVGYTESTNFPVIASGYSTNYSGARDAFVVVFSNSVSNIAFKAGIFLGGTNADEAAGVVVAPGTDLTNLVYVVGATASDDFPITNAYQPSCGGSTDAFICCFGALLTNLPVSTFLGGTADDKAYAVALDASNNLYVAGSTTSTNFPRTSSNNVYLTGWTNAYRGGQDVFVTCLTNNLTNLYASTYIGGTNDDVARCLVVDSSSTTNLEYVYLAGYTTSSNFPTTRAAYDRSYNGGGDAFALRMDGLLTNMYASTYLGGVSNDQALALALSPDSNTLFVAGITASSNDFPSSDAAYQNVFGGGTDDGFVTKFPASLAYGTVKWRKFINSICSSPALTWDGTITIGNETSLFAFTRSGAARWQVPTTSAVADQTEREGLGVPAVGTNNVIYISTDTGKVHAISFTGSVASVAWTFNCANNTPSAWSAVAIDNNNGRLFFAQEVKFYAIRQSNGIGLWTNTSFGSQYSFPAPVIDSSGIIYAANSVDPVTLYAFNATGGVSHTWTTNGNMYSSPALKETNIYAAIGAKLYAFNSDGTTSHVWTTTTEIVSSPAIGTNGVIYIGGGSNLYAFNTNAAPLKTWNVGSDGGAVESSPAISSDGSIIVGSANGFVYSFNPDGTTNWVFETDDELHFQSPLIDSEGTIYVSDDTTIFAIYGSQPPADSAWPMFRHDALRTGNQGMNVADFLRPAKPTVSKGTTTNYIRVGWNASSNALNYELWRNTSNSTDGASQIRRLTQTNYNDSSIDVGKIYYYWLKVKTPVALSAFSASDSGGVPPLPPEGVTASDGVPTNYVQVTWHASSNATKYLVYHSLTNDTDTVTLRGSPTATNYDDYDVAPGQTNYYWVKATNDVAGGSGFSSNDYGGIPCWPPSELSADQGAHIRSVDLSWNLSTNRSSYIVYRNTENNAGTNIINDTTDLTMSDSVTPMRHYYYWVRATNVFGLSGFSASALGWSLLAPPESVSASAGTYPNMIRVSWVIGSTDATVHVIFRSESSDSSTATRQSEVVYNSSTDTNYDDTAITYGISYYYWVAAENNYGSSTWVAASSPGATRPTTPFNLNATDGTYSNMVQVTWSSSPGAVYYTVYRHETFDSSYATELGPTLTNFYNDRSAVYGVLYYYWVKAVNNYGGSDLSTFNSGWRGMVPPDSITAGDGNSTSLVSVTWSTVPNAEAYEIWRGTSSNVASASRLANNVSAVSSPSYSDRSANPGTVYYYWVKAKRGSYSSAFGSSDSGYRAIGLLDIGVSDFVFVPTASGLLAHPSAVSFNVANLSALDMVDPNNTVQYDFYLTRNPVFGDSEAYWFGGTNSSITLRAGASTRVTFSQTMREIISIPVWATGNYYVFMFVNHCLPSAWLDPNPANNVSRRIGDAIKIASFTAFQPVWNDFDGDGKSDLAVYQSATGSWLVWLSASDYAPVDLTLFGGAGYRAVPRDYDGDGKFDMAVYSASGEWRVCLSAFGYQIVLAVGWGGAGQDAVPADYDGDGLVDPAVYLPAVPSAQPMQAGQSATGGWQAWLSGSGYQTISVTGMGGAGQYPAPADYDGDGKTDPAVYQSALGTWRVCLSASGYQTVVAVGWGGSGQLPVPADYDADGRVDPAVYEEATGTWRVWLSSSRYRESNVTGWGGTGQKAVPGDYDGDGRVDMAVYWESMGIWRLWLSSYGYSEIDVLKAGGEGFHAITAGE